MFLAEGHTHQRGVEILGDYGLRPNNSNSHYVPEAMPQATVRIGLRPKSFTLATKTRNFKTYASG